MIDAVPESPRAVSEGARPARWPVVFKVAVAIAVCAWLASRGQLDVSAVLRVDGASLAFGLALLGVQNVGNALRLRWLLRQHGIELGLGRSVALTWIGFAFNQVLPGGAGGDALRAYYTARDNPRSAADAVAAAIVDKAVGLAGLLLLAIVPWILVELYPGGMPERVLGLVRTVSASMTLGFVLIAVGAFVVTSRRAAASVARLQLKSRLSPPLQRVATLIESSLSVHRGRRLRLLAYTAFSAGLHLLSCVVLIVIGRALGNEESIAVHLSLWSVTFLTTAIPISPGGIGVAEAAAAKLWSLSGVTSGATTYLVLRLLCLVHAGVGLVLYVFLRRRQPPSTPSARRDPL